MENDAETAEISEVDVDDELYPGELHYLEIDGKIVFTCF